MTLVLSTIIALAATTQDAAKPPASAGPLREPLEVVEQGTTDRGGIETTLRVQRVDLRLPTGFAEVYRVPGDDGKFMRGNGALFAVFGRSLYQRSAIGALPVTPAGVVYSIGMPGEFRYPGGSLTAAKTPDPAAEPSSRIDRRVHPHPARTDDVASEATAGRSRAPDHAADTAPAIIDAPRAAKSDASPSHDPITDLKLGPARIARES